MKIDLKNKLADSGGLMRYLKNTGWMFSEKILRLLLTLFVGIWVARYLGPSKFGLLSYARSFVGLFTAFVTLGLNGIMVRELVKAEKPLGLLMGTAFRMKLIGGLFILLILISISLFSSNDTQTNILIFIVGAAILFQSFDIINFYFQSQVLSKFAVLANMISVLISSIVKIGLIYLKAPLIAFAWVVLFDAVTLAIGYILFYSKQKLSLRSWKFDFQLGKKLLSDSWPLIFSGLVISIYMKIDQVMIKEMLDNAAVGQYAAAVRISEAWNFIPMVIASSVFPAIINAKQKNPSVYMSRLQMLYGLLVWIALAIALPMTFMSDWLITLLFGNQYNQSGGVLMIHIWATVFVALGITHSRYLVTENLTKKLFLRNLLGASANVVLNFTLIPKYGIQGAATATLLGQFSANFIYDIFDKTQHSQLKMKVLSFVPFYVLKIRNRLN